MVYAFAPGFHLRGLNPQEVGEHLTRLGSEAPLTPERILEDARRADSPTHAAFEWDNERAAHRYRIEQARYLIQAVVTVVNEGEEKRQMRAFVNVVNPDAETDDDPRRYVTTQEAAMSPAYRQQVLTGLLSQAHAWAERAKAFKELSRVVGVISTLPKPVDAKGVVEADEKRPRRRRRSESVKTA